MVAPWSQPSLAATGWPGVERFMCRVWPNVTKIFCEDMHLGLEDLPSLADSLAFFGMLHDGKCTETVLINIMNHRRKHIYIYMSFCIYLSDLGVGSSLVTNLEIKRDSDYEYPYRYPLGFWGVNGREGWHFFFESLNGQVP